MRELDPFDAVLFDLDGVPTSTAAQHFAAWKQMFDGFLWDRAQRRHERFLPFEQDDYNRHVDGMPRYDGVRAFLRSRDLTLPEGAPDDPVDAETVHGLGNRKNALVNEIIRTQGAHAYPGSVALLERLHERGVPLAVVSSSRNCSLVLDVSGLTRFFSAQVDGEVAGDLGLPGKPAPDTFLEAARRLGVPAARAVVVEDALSGVQAGRRGGFGLVVGVDRTGQADALRDHGADTVVADLAELLE